MAHPATEESGLLEGIPAGASPNQSFSVLLGGQVCSIGLSYLPLSEKWYTKFAVGETVLCSGRHVSPRRRLVNHLGLRGEVGAFPLSEAYQELEIGLNGWGTTHQLVYLTEQENAQATWSP